MLREDVWIQTYTGKKFYPFAPRPEDVCLEDIAQALSLTCRFGGHCRELYSVAQHCVLMTERYDLWKATALMSDDWSDPKQVKLGLLFHDAAEAYLCDLVLPVKSCYEDFKIDEEVILLAITEHFEFRVEYTATELRHFADDCMLQWERRDLMTETEFDWELPALPTGLPGGLPTLRCWSPLEAKTKFHTVARKLLATLKGDLTHCMS